MQPIDDVRAISRIAYGFIASKALFAALDLGLFGHLQDGKTTHAALAPGGLLILHDFMLDDDEQGPDLAAQWFLLNLALSTATVSFTPADLTARLTRLGFAAITAREHIHDITKLVLASKPT